MSVIQILDTSFRLYRENFLLFIGIMGASIVPFVIGDIALAGLMTPSLPDLENGLSPADEAHFEYESSTATLVPSLVINLLITFIGVPLGRGALTHAVACRYLGEPAAFGTSYRALLSILAPYVGTTLLVALTWTFGLMLCVIPFFFLFTLFSFVPMVMVLEGRKGFDALARSRDLSAGHRWRVLGLAALEFGLNIGLALALGFLVTFLLPNFVDSPVLIDSLSLGVSYVLFLVLEPLWTLAFILLYYDVRIRKEAFDLHLLARQSA